MKRIIFILIYFLSPILLMLVIFSTNPQKYQDIQILIPMVLGTSAYTWFIWQFILSARPKFIEVAFGMDKLYQFHGLMAIVAISASLVHKVINESIFGESFMTTLGSIALVIFIVVSSVTLVLMTTPFILGKLKLVKWIKKLIQTIKFIRYEFLKLFHNITIIAMIFLFLHVLNTTTAKTSTLAFSMYTLYFICATLFYLYHKVFKAYYLSDYNYTVNRVKQESPNMWTVEFAEPNGKKINYLPGQFGFFTFKSDKVLEQEHPFSISSSGSNGNMSITVKELGDFTRQMNNLKIGDKVYIDAPYGRFSYMNHLHEKDLVFIAGGVGITPIISMLRHLKEFEPNRCITLIWGMNMLSDFIIKDEIDDMLKTMPHLKVIPVVAKEIGYSGEQGYIDTEKLNRLLQEQIKSVEPTGYYLCGPPILMESAHNNLKKMGIKDKQIHFEKFSL